MLNVEVKAGGFVFHFDVRHWKFDIRHSLVLYFLKINVFTTLWGGRGGVISR